MHIKGLRHGVMPTKPGPWHRLIYTSKVMSLAVTCNGAAWSAPVYYLFDDKQFYFFSNPKSSHIQGGEDKMSAASIFKDDDDIKNLEGIQMSGNIIKSKLNRRAIFMAKKYCSHFKISCSTGDILDFFASKFHASLYRFEPQLVYYMDNSRGFGSREIVEL
jgi:uncharacterized protein YhbP (UPF0306 family)